MSSQPDAATATPSAFDLRGRRAVVTGASTGIGSAIALALGAAGAHVAGIYKTDPEGAERTEAAVREHGVDCVLVEGDTGDADAGRPAEPSWRSSASAGSTSGSTTRRG